MTTAESTARQARESTWLEALTRGGFVGYGIIHLALAWLAIQIAVYHHSGHSADQSGALKLLEQQPLGKVLLIVIAIGLAAMTIWQLLLAAVGHTDEEEGRKRTMARLSSAGLTIAYGVLCGLCVKVIVGAEGSSSKSQEKAAAGLLGNGWGRALVVIIGLAVLGGGIGMIVYGLRTMFRKKLDFGSASAPTERTVTWIGRTGYTGKGVTFAIVGVLFVVAALGDKAQRARGLDGALHTLAGQPFGKVLLIIVAIGLVAFGLYGFAQSRFRKV